MAIESVVAEKIIFEINKIFFQASNENIIEDIYYKSIDIVVEEEPGFFLEQPPDTNPERTIYEPNLLGLYTPMQSPGKIVLYQNNLRTFFWSIVRHIVMQNPSIRISKNDLIYTAHMIVQKTYIHEQFHYGCNVFGELFGNQFNSKIEEALAVAYSRQLIDRFRNDRRTWISKIDSHFFDLVVNIAFSFTSPGYKDWRNYKGPAEFARGLKSYVFPNRTTLESNNVDLSMLLTGMISTLVADKKTPEEEIG